MTDLETELFKLNMRNCKRHRPQLHKLVMTCQETSRYLRFESYHTSKVNNLLDTVEERLYYEQKDPISSMAEHMETCLGKLQGITIFLGFGLGYGPLMLEKQSNYTSRALLIIEPDPEIFIHAFRSLDCSSLLGSPDVEFLVGTEIDAFGPTVLSHISRENRLIGAKNVQVVDLPASVLVHGQHYDSAMKKVSQTIKQAVTLIGNCPNDALEGLDTSLSNLKLHLDLPGIKDLEGAFNGWPGIVISSGPSLDKNIRALKQFEGKAIMAAADASLRPLLEEGIKPNFITSLERIEKTGGLFDGISKGEVEDSFLVAAPLCHPHTFKNYPGPVISCEREHGFWRMFDLEKGLLAPGPSAGNMAYRLLKFLGCSPIILVGQDLAFSEDGRTHTKASRYGDRQSNYLNHIVDIKGNYVDSLKTNWVLKMFHEVFEFDVASNTSVTINATEGGAQIAGTQLMTLQEAFATVSKDFSKQTLPDSKISDYIRRFLRHPSLDHSAQKLEHIKQSLSKAIEAISSTAPTIDEALKAVDDFKNLSEQMGDSQEPTDHSLEEQMQRVKDAMNGISLLTIDPEFRIAAFDVLSPIFVHTMMDYVKALSEADSEEKQTDELVRNVENLANNFKILLRYIRELYIGHLELLSEAKTDCLEGKYFARKQNQSSSEALGPGSESNSYREVINA